MFVPSFYVMMAEEKSGKGGEKLMNDRERSLRLRTLAFVLIFLVTGGLHLLENSVEDQFLMTWLFCLNAIIHSGMVMFWMISIRHRLLPTRSRTFTLTASMFMLLMIFIRTIKYRYITSIPMDRLIWYLSYVPTLLIPAFLAMTAAESAFSEKKKENAFFCAILAFAGLMILLVLTNDLSHWVFIPTGSVLTSASEDYVYNFGFYLIYASIGLFYLVGLALTFHRIRGSRSKRVILSVTLMPLGYALAHFMLHFLEDRGLPLPYNVYEIHVFGMMAIWENFIRVGLLPSNSGYEVFFEGMSLPTMITDKSFMPYYQSAWNYSISREELRRSLEDPVYPEPDIRLTGKQIQAGYAFWIEDVGEINRLNYQLTEIGETLETENDLIEAENILREKQARTASRNRIYGEVAEEMLWIQKKIQHQMEDLSPDDPAFRNVIAGISVDNAYVKRKTNLFLMAAENPQIDLRELQLALEESARYLHYQGIEVTVELRGEGSIESDLAMDLYDGFQKILEEIRTQISQLMIVLSPSGIRLSCDLPEPVPFPELPVPASVMEEEGVLYIRLLENGKEVV